MQGEGKASRKPKRLQLTVEPEIGGHRHRRSLARRRGDRARGKERKRVPMDGAHRGVSSKQHRRGRLGEDDRERHGETVARTSSSTARWSSSWSSLEAWRRQEHGSSRSRHRGCTATTGRRRAAGGRSRHRRNSAANGDGAATLAPLRAGRGSGGVEGTSPVPFPRGGRLVIDQRGGDRLAKMRPWQLSAFSGSDNQEEIGERQRKERGGATTEETRGRVR